MYRSEFYKKSFCFTTRYDIKLFIFIVQLVKQNGLFKIWHSYYYLLILFCITINTDIMYMFVFYNENSYFVFLQLYYTCSYFIIQAV